MKKLLMSTGIILISAAVYAAAVNGWDKATWGMSQVKVTALYQADGIQEGKDNTLVIPSVEFEGSTYVATFYFTADKLSKVALFMENSNKSIFYSMVDLFTKKYGAPKKKTDNEYVGYAIWSFPKTKTTISCAYSKGLGGGSPTLQLNFEHVK